MNNISEETSLIGFKAICNFVKELEGVFGKSHKPLKLYNRFLSETKFLNEQSITKNLKVFNVFCAENRTAFETKDFSKFKNSVIQYSPKLFIDMNFIFNKADTETKEVIWRHLLTISAIVDPAGKAKQILKEETSAESDFISNLITKVEKNVKPDSNPMEAISTIMQSGLLNELMGDISSNEKKLDMGKLLGTVQKMVSGLSGQVGDDPQAKQAFGMINNMMSGIQNGQAPDMAGMMGMMTSMMSSMNGSSSQPSIETIEEEEENKKD